jgi:hypothetical protein
MAFPLPLVSSPKDRLPGLRRQMEKPDDAFRRIDEWAWPKWSIRPE